MKSMIPLAAVATVSASTAPAWAVDFSASGFFSSRIEARAPDIGDGGSRDSGSGRLQSDVGVLLSARTPTTEWRLAPGVRGGLSTTASPELRDLRPRVSGSVNHVGPRQTFGLTGSLTPDFANSVRFDDLTSTVDRRDDVLQITASARADWSVQLDPRNSLSAAASFRLRDFVESAPDLSRTVTVGGDLRLRHAATPRTTLSLSGGARSFFNEGDDRPDSQTVNLRIGGDHRPASGLTLAASLGASRTDRDGGDANIGVVGSLSASWAARSDTTLTLGLTQDVDQTTQGEIENNTALRLGAQHAIDARQSVGLAAAVSFNTPVFDDGGDDRQVISLSPSYSYALSRDWSMTLSYSTRVDREGGDFGVSNRVFLRIGWRFSLVP
jgi:hypothetical protein